MLICNNRSRSGICSSVDGAPSVTYCCALLQLAAAVVVVALADADVTAANVDPYMTVVAVRKTSLTPPPQQPVATEYYHRLEFDIVFVVDAICI